jgi:hypothetical protein
MSELFATEISIQSLSLSFPMEKYGNRQNSMILRKITILSHQDGQILNKFEASISDLELEINLKLKKDCYFLKGQSITVGMAVWYQTLSLVLDNCFHSTYCMCSDLSIRTYMPIALITQIVQYTFTRQVGRKEVRN